MLFEQILSLVPCAVFWKDSDGVFQGCNQQFLAFSGLSDKEKIIGKTDKELPWANRWEDYYRDDQHVIVTGKTITRIEEVALVDKKISAHTTKAPWIKDGQCLGVIGVIYDISELIDAKEKAETANHLKTEFIQNMQHDIRTPASGVWTFLRIMADEETDPEKKKKLSLLRDSAKQLYDICNDIVDFDKTEHGEIPILSRNFDVHSLMSDVVDLNRAVAHTKDIDLSFSIDPNIPHILRGDQHRISRILINLIGNAIKFTERGKVEILVKALQVHDKDIILQFEIHDTGVGIPKDKIIFIYEKFMRGTPSNREMYKGSGLGLKLVKQFVHDIGGEIDVFSEPNKGTIFYVTLPLTKPLAETIYHKM